MVLYGAGTAANLLARYAGTDLAAPRHRARAVSTVLVATTVGGIAGPNLVTPAGQLATALGLPHLTGLFLISALAFALAAVALLVWLRPDPLLLARTLPDEPEEEQHTGQGPVSESPHPAMGRRPGLVIGSVVMALAQLIMVAIMTMTPVHMHDHGQSTAASGFVIALHVGAMYLPSPLSGTLADRFDPTAVAAASGVTLLASGVLAALAPGDSVPLLTLALVLLGIGWNFGLVSGTAIVTEAVPLGTRAKTQGAVDVVVAIAGAVGGLLSGIVVAAASYALLSIAGAAIALALLPFVTTAKRGASPAPSAAPAKDNLPLD